MGLVRVRPTHYYVASQQFEIFLQISLKRAGTVCALQLREKVPNMPNAQNMTCTKVGECWTDSPVSQKDGLEYITGYHNDAVLARYQKEFNISPEDAKKLF